MAVLPRMRCYALGIQAEGIEAKAAIVVAGDVLRFDANVDSTRPPQGVGDPIALVHLVAQTCVTLRVRSGPPSAA